MKACCIYAAFLVLFSVGALVLRAIETVLG
jgi:hypothetical protein